MGDKPDRGASLRIIALATLVLLGVLAAGVLAVEHDDAQTEARSPIRPAATAEERQEARAERREQMVEVPDVIDLDIRTAEAKVADHGFRVARTLTVLEGAGGVLPEDPCLGTAPGSRVASQYPEPGEREDPGARVELRPTEYVQVGCSRREDAPDSCTSDDLVLHVGGELPDHYAGASEAGAAVVKIKVERVGQPPACQLDQTLSVAIEEPSGVLASGVAGSPGVIRLNGALHPGDKLFAHWYWESWCGSREQVVAVANVGDHRESRQPLVVPPCRGRSSLYPYYFAGFGP
jgi:PASTA domain